MKFKYLESFEGVNVGGHVTIEEVEYYVETAPRPGKSAILVDPDGRRLLALLQTSEFIVEKTS